MKIIIHRGTHQIGGVATEIRTRKTRIIIDMGDELSTDPEYEPKPLTISGVTDAGWCDAVLFTHNHGDHIGQLCNVDVHIPIYMGEMSRDIMLKTNAYRHDHSMDKRLDSANIFSPGRSFSIGDIKITPYSIDHSACDSYMFLIEAEGKRVLHTGDFRTHGFRGKVVAKIIDKLVGKIDILITEGTTLSRANECLVTEHELQGKFRDYIKDYKYVYVLCASTNLERICGIAHIVPKGKYFICDRYESDLIDIIQEKWGEMSSLYRIPKLTVYGENLLTKFKDRGFVMMVRANRRFEKIIRQFDPSNGIIIYSMWDGYRTKPDSNIPGFLKLTGSWESLHTSGHASAADICMLIEKTQPDMILPMHTESPNSLQGLCPDKNVIILQDGEELTV